uniref:Uncharacterized protein n=1 Tax=Panagrolaimus davidi TaxID=227884 RepID=A0A914PBZ5_9BILA
MKINPSKQSKKQFSLMLQTTIAQTITLFTFGLPCLLWLGAFLLPETPTFISSISFYLGALATMFPIFDVIVVVSVVKPYREATLKLFVKKLPKSSIKFIVKSAAARNSIPQRSLSIVNGRVNHF